MANKSPTEAEFVFACGKLGFKPDSLEADILRSWMKYTAVVGTNETKFASEETTNLCASVGKEPFSSANDVAKKWKVERGSL